MAVLSAHSGRVRVGAAAVLASLLAIACGGPGKQTAEPDESAATTSTVPADAGTTVPAEQSPVVNQSTSTTAAAAGRTATTAAAVKAGTTSKTTALKSSARVGPVGGIA